MSVFKAAYPGAELNLHRNGKLDVTLAGFAFKSECCTVTADGARDDISWSLLRRGDDFVLIEGAGRFGSYKLRFAPDSGAAGRGFSMRFTGRLRKKCESVVIELVKIGRLKADHLVAQGAKMGGCRSLQSPVTSPANFAGNYQTVITAKGRHLRIATPLEIMQPTEVTGCFAGRTIRDLATVVTLNHWGLKDIEADAVSYVAGPDGFALMNEYADRFAPPSIDREMLAPGWNSWDYYRWTITEEEVLRNAEFIARDPVLSRHVKRVIVDDGWQYCCGEWDANSLFPNGMEYLARELRKMKFVPGLWFAPGVSEPHARMSQLNPEYMAMSEGGQPCLGFACMQRLGFLLDPTVPEVKKYLYGLFARYAAMGYGYFKLDFLAQILKARRFHDAGVAHSRLVHELVAPIREATRGKAKLLGCNYPFASGTDLVDAVRIGSDIHATWHGISTNVESVATRFWMNKKLWVGDPDFALCRALDTSSDPDITRLKCCYVYVQPETAYNKLYEFKLVDIRRAQAEVLLGIVLMNGGSVNLSDNLPQLDEAGVELARKVVSAESGETAIPLDLFETERPGCYLQKLSRGGRVLLVNWTDAPERRKLELRKHGITGVTDAFNFWTGKKINLKTPVIDAELAPRSSLLVEFR